MMKNDILYASMISENLILCADERNILSNESKAEDDMNKEREELRTETFNTWSAFDDLQLPSNWTKFVVNETKIVALMQFSRHVHPISMAVKEVRTGRDLNEVCCLALGKEVSRREVRSREELIALTSEFFALVYCHGLPPISGVTWLKYAEVNILNRWQSRNCTKQIKSKNVADVCERCSSLDKAQIAQQKRSIFNFVFLIYLDGTIRSRQVSFFLSSILQRITRVFCIHQPSYLFSTDYK